MANPAVWVWILTDGAGTNLCELTTASGKTIAYKRNFYAEASCAISYEDDAAQKLMDALYGSSSVSAGIPRLKCYRNSVLRFYGYLIPFQGEAEEAAMISLVFRDPFGRLLGEGDDRGRFTADFTGD